MVKQKILGVDDDPRNLKIMSLALADSYEFLVAPNGTEGLRLCNSEKPDLVLLDIMMPGVDGYEVCRAIKGNPDLGLTKVILISGKAMIEERLRGYLVGADDYITKPFATEELEAKVRVFLRLVAAEKQKQEALLEVQKMSNELIGLQSTQTQSVNLASIGEMTSGIVHEINNPVTIISMYANQIIEEVNFGHPDFSQVLDKAKKIFSTVDRISKIIRGIKNLARNGEADPFEDCSINEIMDEVLQFYRAGFKSKDVVIQYTQGPELHFEARSSQIYQVILNLINNAYDAIELLADRWIAIEIHDRDTDIELKMIDSGPGIPKEIQEKLFSPFFTTKGVGKGTGLGLNIINKIIRNHHGTIWIDNTLNHTCFCVRLPKRQIPLPA